jgi:hypothetical protein
LPDINSPAKLDFSSSPSPVVSKPKLVLKDLTSQVPNQFDQAYKRPPNRAKSTVLFHDGSTLSLKSMKVTKDTINALTNDSLENEHFRNLSSVVQPS